MAPIALIFGGLLIGLGLVGYFEPDLLGKSDSVSRTALIPAWVGIALAFCGIVMSLFVTQTTFSIPSLFGAIMSVGVASANSILLVTFAREYREQTGCSATEFSRRRMGSRGRIAL